MHDHYKVLGVPRDASAAQIKTAYRTVAKVVHPDASGESTGLFSLITDAYDVLGDEARRAQYDRELAQSEEASTGPTSPPQGPPDEPVRHHFRHHGDPIDRPAPPADERPVVRETLPHLWAVAAGAFVAFAAGFYMLGSPLYDRIVWFVNEGDVLLGYRYNRADQQVPASVGEWVIATIFLLLPLTAGMVATYAWKVRRDKYRSSRWDVLVATTVAFLGLFLHPVVLDPTGVKGLLLYWPAFAVLWLLGTKAIRFLLSLTKPNGGTPATT